MTYLFLINLIMGITFVSDKRRAEMGKSRVPEHVLHILELLGGAFIVVPMIFLIHHKNQKRQYYLISFALLLLWVAIFYFYYLK